MSENPLFCSFLLGTSPLNLGGEIVTPRFRGVFPDNVAKRARGGGEEGVRLRREGLWLEGRVLQLPLGRGPDPHLGALDIL